MSKKIRMILIKGIHPQSNLGLNWVDTNDAVLVCTAYQDEAILMGKILLTTDNLSKLKHFNFHLLEREIEGEWKPVELDYTDIFRPYVEPEELVNIINTEGGESFEDEDIQF